MIKYLLFLATGGAAILGVLSQWEIPDVFTPTDWLTVGAIAFTVISTLLSILLVKKEEQSAEHEKSELNKKLDKLEVEFSGARRDIGDIAAAFQNLTGLNPRELDAEDVSNSELGAISGLSKLEQELKVQALGRMINRTLTKYKA